MDAAKKKKKKSGMHALMHASRLFRLLRSIGTGFTVAVMILVDNLGGWFPSINHSPWNYVTLADFVMPFFLFMVHVADPPLNNNMRLELGHNFTRC